jgi:hypothetical protein
MDGKHVERALRSPDDSVTTLEWVESVVRLLGPRFIPGEGFEGYGLDREQEQALSGNLARAREFLGPRLDDLVYRVADAFLSDIDGDYRLWARPVSQPPARLWLVERPDLPQRSDMLEPRVGLAFEDKRGIWWSWEPATEFFYDDVPWLFTHFYYDAEACTEEMLMVESLGRLRFTKLAIDEAFRLIDDGQLGGAGEDDVRVRRDQQPRLALAEVMKQLEG